MKFSLTIGSDYDDEEIEWDERFPEDDISDFMAEIKASYHEYNL